MKDGIHCHPYLAANGGGAASYGLTDRCTRESPDFQASYGLTDRCTRESANFTASYGLADRN